MGSGSSKSGNKSKPTREPTVKETSEEEVDDSDEKGLEWFDEYAVPCGYPPPKPAQTDLKFPPGYFDDVDLNAKMVPASALSSFERLQRSLFDGADNDAKKVRAILAWFSSLDLNQMEFPQTVDDNSPVYYLEQIHNNELLFEQFFTFLCREMGVPCVMILGDIKGANYEVGDADVSGKAIWTAVYVNSDWRLVQPRWATSGIVGYDKGGKILIDDSTTTTAERQEETAGVNISILNDYYIFTAACEFIHDCFPEKKEWQLLQSPFSWNDFIQEPLFSQSFFSNNFSFKGKTLGVQKSENGMCRIAIMPPDIMMTTMRSNLFFHERKSNQSWEEALDFGQQITIDRFVFKNRNLAKGEIEFEVRFPAIGIYQLDLLEMKDEYEVTICSFQLDCDSVLIDCKPYPQVPPIGYGPGPETFHAGLKPRSHLTGRVEARVSTSVKINFSKVVKDVQKTKQYKSDLKSDYETIVESHTWVSESADKNNYNIEVNPQMSGEYLLAVSAKDTNQDDDEYENICNYLIDVKKDKEENITEIIEDEGIEEEEDSNVDSEESLRTGLDNAVNNQSFSRMKAAISKAERSEFYHQLKPSIQQAKDELTRLKNGGQNYGSRLNIPHPTPPLDARTLMVIKRYPHPQESVYDMVKAFLLILGEKPETLTDWKEMKKPLREEGNKGVIYRAWHLDIRQVPEEILINTKKILAKYNVHSIRENSDSAAAFYDWMKEVIRLTEKHRK